MKNIKTTILRHDPRSDYLPEIKYLKDGQMRNVYRGVEYPLRDLIYNKISFYINCELDEKH